MHANDTDPAATRRRSVTDSIRVEHASQRTKDYPMATEPLVYVGTYSEPILFGTGQVLQGQGKGIYAFRFDADAAR